MIVNFTKKLPNIRGDEDQLKQVFLNLIKNAMQAIGEKGKILIKGSSHGNENYLKVSISDNGCGIDKYEMQNIFKPYFTTKYDGTGLGLIIIEKILKAHNANISIESNKKDKLTIFSIVFPTIKKDTKHLIEFKKNKNIL